MFIYTDGKDIDIMSTFGKLTKEPFKVRSLGKQRITYEYFKCKVLNNNKKKSCDSHVKPLQTNMRPENSEQ